jgi:steroid delta-isomerase-like uncharacterized protein
MVGCQDKEAMAELEEFKAQAAAEARNMELVKGYIEELNKGNSEVFAGLLAPDFKFYSPSINPNPLSREKILGQLKMIFQGFPDAKYNIKGLFASGDRVINWNVFTGTHEGDYMGLPATGKKIETSSILIYRFDNGMIVEEREEFDMLGAMMQLGMELKPKEEK